MGRGYPHDSRADNDAYPPHEGRADNAPNWHYCRADKPHYRQDRNMNYNISFSRFSFSALLG